MRAEAEAAFHTQTVMPGLDPGIHVSPVATSVAKDSPRRHGESRRYRTRPLFLRVSVVKRCFHPQAACRVRHVDGRVKPGHDELSVVGPHTIDRDAVDRAARLRSPARSALDEKERLAGC